MDSGWRRTRGGLSRKTSNGKAKIYRTPRASMPPARAFSLDIDDQFHDSYETEAEAIAAAEQILQLPKTDDDFPFVD